MRGRARCCAVIAKATPASTRTRKTMPFSSSACSSCFKPVGMAGQSGAGGLEGGAAVGYRVLAVPLALRAERQQGNGYVMPFGPARGSIAAPAAAYAGQNFTCRQPATSIEELEQRLLDA